MYRCERLRKFEASPLQLVQRIELTGATKSINHFHKGYTAKGMWPGLSNICQFGPTQSWLQFHLRNMRLYWQELVLQILLTLQKLLNDFRANISTLCCCRQGINSNSYDIIYDERHVPHLCVLCLPGGCREV